VDCSRPAPLEIEFVRLSLRLSAAISFALVLTTGAADARELVVGVGDDWVKWRSDTAGIVRIQREAGFRTVKVAFPWRPGMWHPGKVERYYVERIAKMASLNQRVVVAFGGAADDAPRSAETRQQFCSYVRSVLSRLPAVRDVVIWNEVNSPAFWRPQRDAPAEYAALLGRCWDLLHRMRPDVNVISSTAPRHLPLRFLRDLGDAYARSGRTRPLVDSFGHNPYPQHAAESPSAVHPDGYVGQGDYNKLLRVLREAFAGTPQAAPGERDVTIWYLETGFQTVPPVGGPLYFGRENEKRALPALADSGIDQAMQLRAAIELAYCQPAVGALFNFQLADERRLGGWQSGILWANWRPKPSFHAVRSAVDDVHRRAVACRQSA
jgi:hypothetical protein